MDGELQHMDRELQQTGLGVTAHGWGVTAHGWGVTAHWMGICSTLDGELQHTGWVKINAGNGAGRFRNIFGQNKSYQ